MNTNKVLQLIEKGLDCLPMEEREQALIRMQTGAFRNVLSDMVLLTKTVQPLHRNVKVMAFIGKPGSGKSFAATKYCTDLYGSDEIFIHPDQPTSQLHGYTHEKALIIEDMHGLTPYSVLMHWLDGVRMLLNCEDKYPAWAAWELVILCSNLDPRTWYSEDYQMRSLIRRLHGNCHKF